MGVDEDVVVVEVDGGIPDNITILLLIRKEKALFHHQKWNNNELRQENGESTKKKSKAPQDTCYRCGMEGHWSRTCRTAKHLVDLYQASLKENGKKI